MMNRMNSRAAALALGLTAAASTGCDKNEQPTPAVVPTAVPSTEVVQAPAQSAAPTAAPAPKPEAKGYTPVTVSPQWNMSEKAQNYICDRLEPSIGTGVVLIEDGSFWIADCTKKQVVKLLNKCDDKNLGVAANVEDATCSRDKDGFRTVDVTSFVEEGGKRSKIVMTGSDRNQKQTMPLNAHWPENEKYEVATGEDAPMFSDKANLWILHERHGKAAPKVAVTPQRVTPVAPVVPTQEKSNDHERRIGALERRVTGVETGLAKVRVDIAELAKPKKVNTKDADSIAADAAGK